MFRVNVWCDICLVGCVFWWGFQFSKSQYIVWVGLDIAGWCLSPWSWSIINTHCSLSTKRMTYNFQAIQIKWRERRKLKKTKVLLKPIQILSNFQKKNFFNGLWKVMRFRTYDGVRPIQSCSIRRHDARQPLNLCERRCWVE